MFGGLLGVKGLITVLEDIILRYEKDFFSLDFCRSRDNVENRLCLDLVTRSHKRISSIFLSSDLCADYSSSRELYIQVY